MTNPFIDHPYVAMVMAIVISLCGVLALFALPVSQYPDVTPPQVNISTTYPGADAQTLLKTVVEPIERQVNGVRDMLYLSSQSSDSGSAVITATFAVGSDGDMAVQNVQDRVNWASPQLPQAVQKEGIIVQEQSGNILLAISFYSPGGSYDSLFLANYAQIHLIDKLKRIKGVAEVQLFGSSDYAMRVWLNAEKLAALSIGVETVLEAIQAQNTQISAGAVGAAPTDSGQLLRYNVRTLGRLPDVEAFQNIIVTTRPDGAQVKLGDVARVELGEETYTSISSLNGRPTVMIVLFQRASANALEITADCRRVLEESSRDFPPDMKFAFQYDSTRFIRQSIDNVARTFLTAVLLVALVVLLFLQNWRMALVPVLAIPVSIVGTFALLKLLGYSINLVTLFGLILAIGIVVDDAIIVIENVSRLISTEKLSPQEAARKSMTEITGAIVATTLVLLAMFVPITFLPGITGELYRQFGVTISVAVLLSAVNALTLSPALAALLLKPHREEPPRFILFRWFNAAFSVVGSTYSRWMRRFILLALPVLAAYLVVGALTAREFAKVPTGFVPAEDQGVFFINLQTANATALPQTRKSAGEAAELLKKIPGVQNVVTIAGFNILTMNTSANNAFVMAVLEPWEKRPPVTVLIDQAYGALMKAQPDALAMIFEPPPLPGIGAAGGFDFVIEEPGGTDSAKLAQVLDLFLFEATQRPELRNVFSTFNASTPYLYLEIDRAKALRMNLSLEAIDQTLENVLGYTFINDFNNFGRVYKVEAQGENFDRDIARRLRELYVVSSTGKAVPFSSFSRLTTRVAPASLSRYNLNLSAQIQGSNAPEYSSGQAMRAMEEIARKVLPETMSYDWTGLSYQERLAGESAWMVFALALLFIYLFLAGLYESWLLPLPVLLAIPAALAGALLFVTVSGVSDNVYTRIGIVLLFGMACKTAILLVDFAKQKSDAGREPTEAALQAADLRFRAIQMTAFAFIFGTLPLLFAAGPGAGSQRSIGAVVVGGMIAGTLGVLLLVPLFYAFIQRKKGTSKLGVWLAWGGGVLLLCAGGCYTPPPGGSLIDVKNIRDRQPQGDLKLLENRTSLSLEECVKIAFANNPTYRSTEFAIRSARMRYYQALGAYSPSLSAGVALGDQLYKGSGSSYETASTFYTFTTVQATWVLFDGLSREFAINSTKIGISREEFLRADAARTLRKAIGVTYWELVSAQAQIAIADADVQFQEQQLKNARQRYAVGDIPKSEVLNFEGRRNQAVSARIKAKNRVTLGLFSLAQLLGYAEGTLPTQLKLQEPTGKMPLVPPLEIGLDQALAGRPDLNALREQLKQLKYVYYTTYSAYSPTVAAFANYSYSSNSTQDSGNNPTGFGNFYMAGNSFNYGLSANLTLFNGFTRYNASRMMRAILDQQYLSASATWLEVVREVRDAYANFASAQELTEVARSTRAIMREQRDLVAKEYEAGDVDIVRLDSAQNQFVQSENALVEAQTSLRRARIELDAAIGEVR